MATASATSAAISCEHLVALSQSVEHIRDHRDRRVGQYGHHVPIEVVAADHAWDPDGSAGYPALPLIL